MRTLIFTPTFGDGPRPELLASVQTQVCAGQELSHEVIWHNPYPAPDVRNVLAQFVRGREMALAGGFDALLTVEHDMRLPQGAVAKLWEALDGSQGAGVVYGVYLFRHGSNVLNAWDLIPGSRNLGESLSTPRHRTKLRRAIAEQIYPVSGVGFGCTLIRRDVLEQIPFRSGESGFEAPDIPFATDCLRAGVRQVAHFGVLCGHMDADKWLMPLGSAEMGETTHVRALQNVVVRIGGGTKELISGQEYYLPSYELKDIVRAGFVTILALDPPVERAVKPGREKAVGRGQGTGVRSQESGG